MTQSFSDNHIDTKMITLNIAAITPVVPPT